MKHIILALLSAIIFSLATITPNPILLILIGSVLVISWEIVAITVSIRKWDRF